MQPQDLDTVGAGHCRTYSPNRASVLNSERAIEVNIAIMRAFVKLRQMLESNEKLNRKFGAVMRKLSTHDKYFKVVFDELRRLTEHPTLPRKQIGFKTSKKV